MAVSLSNLLIIWCFPVGLCVGIFLIFSLVLYVLLISPLEFHFKQDIWNKFEKKSRLPSGARLRHTRWLFPYLLMLLMLDNGVQATLLYRISHFLAVHGVRVLASVLHSFAKFLTNIDISPLAEIGPGILFYHGLGIVIGKHTRIGSRVTICQDVTTGGGRPQIGDDVILWAGVKVVGSVTIGARSEVGANAVVVSDVPPDCVALGVPARRFISKIDPEQQLEGGGVCCL